MIVDYKNVDIYQKDNVVLKHVNFRADENRFFFITGKVGSGKSTFLSSLYLNVFGKGDKQEVLGYNLAKMNTSHTQEMRRQMGIVFQNGQLLDDRSIYSNLNFILKATGWKKREEREERIETVLKTVDMEGTENKYPHELSGGEQLRIAIARAILNTPRLIIADEPTGNLDKETSERLVALLQEIRAKGTTIIMSTHNMLLLPLVPDAIVYRCDDQKMVQIAGETIDEETPEIEMAAEAAIEPEEKQETEAPKTEEQESNPS